MPVEPLWDFEILDHELSVLWAPLVVNVLDSMLHVVWKHLTTCSFKNSKISSKSFPFFYIKDIGTDNLGLFGWSYFLNFLFFANLDFNFSSILLNNTNMNWGLSFTDSKTGPWSFQAHTAHNSWFHSWSSQPGCHPFWNPWLCRRNISILQLDKTIFMVIFAFRYNVKISCTLENPCISSFARSHENFYTNHNHFPIFL